MRLTHQGVRDLNDLGGKRLNGKRPGCKHLAQDVEVIGRKEFQDHDGPFFVNVLGCSRCGENLGPETEFEVRVKD